MTSHMRRWHLALAMRLTSILLFALLFSSSASAADPAGRATLKKHREVEAPLKTLLIRVSYANAADMVSHVKSMLSDRGTVTYDARSNTLIVRDVE